MPHSVIPDPIEVLPEVLEAEQRRPSVTWAGLYALVGSMVLMWSVNFIIGKSATRQVSALALSAIRIQVAAIMLLGIFVARRGLTGFAEFRANWKLMALLGLFGVAGNQGFFVLGLALTSVAHSSLIVSLGPVFVLVLARLHGLEKLSRLKIAGLAVSMAGV